jgi:DNA-binding CsgD family transcriptional regulator
MEDEAISPLTPRQWEVAGLIAQGLSNREIAQGLGLSLFTVRHYVSHVLRKLEVKSRTQVAFLVGQQQNYKEKQTYNTKAITLKKGRSAIHEGLSGELIDMVRDGEVTEP